MITFRLLYDFLFKSFECEKEDSTDLVIQETIKGFVRKCIKEKADTSLLLFIDYLRICRKYSEYKNFDFANFQTVSESRLLNKFRIESIITFDEAFDLIDTEAIKKLIEVTRKPNGKVNFK